MQAHHAGMERIIIAKPGGLMLIMLIVGMFGSIGGGIGCIVGADDADRGQWSYVPNPAAEEHDEPAPVTKSEQVVHDHKASYGHEMQWIRVRNETPPAISMEVWVVGAIACGLLSIVCFVCMFGCYMVGPNEGRVLQFFGKYVGTVKQQGLMWANPFFTKKAISLKIRNFESSHLKVNDHDGSPIEIAAIVVWRVIDTAEALFEVDNYQNYIQVQSESALRNLATQYPYDAHDDGKMSLRANTADIAVQLQREVQERLAKAGVEVLEARISHLAYAPEIAAVMLRRQQAAALIAARTKIVEGAVGMVEMALDLLQSRNVVEFDPERKAAMVSNLLVVLCGERDAQPILNTGTIHH